MIPSILRAAHRTATPANSTRGAHPVLRQSFRTPGVGHPLFSRRLLNRAWWIAGASDDNDDLRLKIRDRLIKGALFPPPARIWAGSGTGRLCVICGTTISSREVECEMTLGPVTIWAHHLPCHALWREESARLNLASHEEAGVPRIESPPARSTPPANAYRASATSRHSGSRPYRQREPR